MSSTGYTASSPLQLLDQLHDQRHRLDRAHVVPGRQDIECRHVLAIELGLLLGECGPVRAGSGGAFQQRVVDVGDVLHVIDLEPAVAPDPVEQVEGDVGVGVADVGRVVGRDAADVDAVLSRWPGRSATSSWLAVSNACSGGGSDDRGSEGTGRELQACMASPYPGASRPKAQNGGHGMDGHSPRGRGSRRRLSSRSARWTNAAIS